MRGLRGTLTASRRPVRQVIEPGEDARLPWRVETRLRCGWPLAFHRVGPLRRVPGERATGRFQRLPLRTKGLHPHQTSAVARGTQVRRVAWCGGSGGLPDHVISRAAGCPRSSEECATLGELRLTDAIGQEAIVSYALEPARENMEDESAQKLHGIQGPGAQPVPVGVVFPAEGHGAVFQGHEPPVGDGHTMGVACEVCQHMGGVPQRFGGMHHPLGRPQGVEKALPALRLRECLTASGTEEGAPGICLPQGGDEQPAKQPTEDAHWEKEAGTAGHPSRAVRCQAPARDDTMEVRMVVQLLAPGMQDRQKADVSPSMLRITGESQECFGGGTEQQVIEEAGIGQRQGTERGGQRKDHVRIRHVQPLAFPGCQPGRLRGPLAFRAVPIATGVILDHLVPAVLALGFVSPKRGGTAPRNRVQHLALLPGGRLPIALQIRRAIVLDDVGHFQPWVGHGNASSAVGSSRESSGLAVSRMAVGDTWRERLVVRRL